jgi:hypothetical protein
MLFFAQHIPSPPQNPTAGVSDLYVRLPEGERHNFQTALEALIPLEKAGNWGDLFDRFYLNDKGLTKKQFIDQEHRLRSVVFVPAAIYYVPVDQTWIVSGCALFSPPPTFLGKNKGAWISEFGARRTSDGWRFDVPPAIKGFDDANSLRPCDVAK